ncbi:MAG: hypothetical protein R3C46_05485 [Hyphomonadaceae bacterium]
MTPKQFHAVAGAFPETEFATSYGQPAWKAFGKFFTRLRAEDDSVVLGQVPFDEREMLCEADPETFHFTDHYRNYPIVLARLKRLTPAQLRGYLERQWRHNAPKKWIKAWDEAAGQAPATPASDRGRKRTAAGGKRPAATKGARTTR